MIIFVLLLLIIFNIVISVIPLIIKGILLIRNLINRKKMDSLDKVEAKEEGAGNKRKWKGSRKRRMKKKEIDIETNDSVFFELNDKEGIETAGPGRQSP